MPAGDRYLRLLLLLVAACLALWVSGRPSSPAPARWPDSDAVFEIAGWQLGPVTVTPTTPGALVERTYSRPDGLQAQLVVWTAPQPQAKMLLRKGPDRDFLGAGYTIESAPGDLLPPIQGGGARIARQGDQAWLLVYTFGERRGRLGDGALAWTLAELDALQDRPNQYFLARVGVPFDAAGPAPRSAALELSAVFDRLADWYSRPELNAA